MILSVAGPGQKVGFGFISGGAELSWVGLLAGWLAGGANGNGT